MIDIKSMNASELTEFITQNGFPRFRAAQIRGWLAKGVTDFDEMRNIPSDLKNTPMTGNFPIQYIICSYYNCTNIVMLYYDCNIVRDLNQKIFML